MDKKQLSIGQHVFYFDEHGQKHSALVTQQWGCKGYVPERGNPSGPPAINLLFISGDTSRMDDCGRQSERRTSTVHKCNQDAPGNYWIEAE